MSRTTSRIVAVITAITALIGCSSGTPIQPEITPNLSAACSGSYSNRHLWGLWEISIDPFGETEIIPVRLASMHLNVVNLLENTGSTSCIAINNIQIIPGSGQYDIFADVELTHPLPGLPKYTGFDVRGIVITDANLYFPAFGRSAAWGEDALVLSNADGYTSLFNPTEFPESSPLPSFFKYFKGQYANGTGFTATLNPFKAYCTDKPRRMFESGTSNTASYHFTLPVLPFKFGYAVDASWVPVTGEVTDPENDFPISANCPEAYNILASVSSGLAGAGSSAGVAVEFFDHQGLNTVSTVSVEAPDLFSGEVLLEFTEENPDGGFRYTGTVQNEMGLTEGDYPVLIRVIDKNTDPNLGIVDAYYICPVHLSNNGWARTWGGIDYDIGQGVAIDGSGNVYATGYFHETVEFDPGTGVDNHTSNGSVDAFLIKFDSNGIFLWARTWGGPSADYGYGVAIDGSGNAYVTGYFKLTGDFDPGAGVDNHTSYGEWDIFLSKFDSNGNFIWARTWGGTIRDEGSRIAIDGSGNAYVTGYFRLTVDFDPDAGVDSYTSYGSKDIFLSKFDSNGNYIWARTWGGAGGEEGNDVAIDESGSIFVTGEFSNAVDFDPGSGVEYHTSNGSTDVFLSKFDSNGNFIGARTWGGTSSDDGFSVAIDGSGKVYVTGFFQKTVDFDPGTGVDYHISKGLNDAFLSKFDSDGNFIWARTWGRYTEDIGEDVAIDGSGNAYVTGDFHGTVDFDPGAGFDFHTSNGASDAFLSKFDSNGNFIWTRTWGGSLWQKGLDIIIDGSGNAYVTGYYNNTVDFDPGAGIDNHTSNGNSDAFLSKFPPDGNW